MAHYRIRIEEMEYRPEDKTLLILAVDEFQEIVTLEVTPGYPRQLAADLEFVARHPDARVLLDGDPRSTLEQRATGVRLNPAEPVSGEDRERGGET